MNQTGTITRALGRYYTVRYDRDEINCTLRGRIKKDERLKKYSAPACVGDIVDFTVSDDNTGAIEEVRDRRNVFTRKDRGRGKEDLIAANLDQVVIVQSFVLPDMNVRFIDRLLVRAVKEDIPAVLCCNKSDLAIKDDIKYVKDYYRDIEITLHVVSAKTGSGLKKLSRDLDGKTSLFLGYSGVGKTSILNRLYPGLDLRTNEVSESTGKGKHTTTNVQMVTFEKGTRIMDTPGMREFGLMDIEPHMLWEYFPDFYEYAGGCGFSPCTHDHEPKCSVRDHVEEGDIHEDRYVSYLNILYSLKEHYENLY